MDVNFVFLPDQVRLRIDNLASKEIEVFDGTGTKLTEERIDNYRVFPLVDHKSLVNSEFTIRAEGSDFSIGSPFEFDVARSTDVNYITEKVFNFRTRIKDRDTLFHYLQSILEVMEPNRAMSWGVVSVLGYRVAEHPKMCKALGMRLVKARYDAIKTDYHKNLNPVGLRWWISSGATLVPLAEIYGMRDEAIEICRDLHSKNHLADKHPMVMWNLSSSMLLYGLYLYGKGDRIKARDVFYEVHALCVRGVSALFSANNPRMLSQYPDCNALLEIGRTGTPTRSIFRIIMWISLLQSGGILV
jgi:hypothetical protein